MNVATPATKLAFAGLVHGDAHWLRQEFDALIAACFGQPPATPPPAPPRVPPHRRPPALRRWRQPRLMLTASPRRGAAPGPRHPRSPPA